MMEQGEGIDIIVIRSALKNPVARPQQDMITRSIMKACEYIESTPGRKPTALQLYRTQGFTCLSNPPDER